MNDGAPSAGDHADQVRALFDSKAAGWPGKYAPDGRLAGRLNQFAGAVPGLVAAGGKVLDLGCGSGELARCLADVGYLVNGCDIAPRMLQQAAAADQRQQVSWTRLDPRWQTLPFASASLDAVVAASVLEYVTDPLAVLRECARVLRPGGILLFTVPDQAHPVRWLECPLGLAAKTPFARAAGGAWPRLGRYLTYLRTSRQRRGARWWHASAKQAGVPRAASRAATAAGIFALARLHRAARHHRGGSVTTAVTIDIAGGQLGGAARYGTEVYGYLERSARDDIRVIGMQRRLSPAWLALREAAAARRSRRVALNNVGFLTPGGERWTLVANSLHFLTPAETAAQVPALPMAMSRQIPVVYRAARRSDVLVAPSTAMAERIKTTLPDVADRVVVRLHPVSANPAPRGPVGSQILCPVLFAPYKNMPSRLGEWLAAVDQSLDRSVRMIVTADATEVPASLAANPRLVLVGRLGLGPLCHLWASSQAVYFPSGLESFGFPLAEARVNGQPVIAQDTPQNREIAGPALCGYALGDLDSLRHATETALSMRLAPDPGPFDPDAYFDWMLGDRS